jgi:hypothetical protein
MLMGKSEEIFLTRGKTMSKKNLSSFIQDASFDNLFVDIQTNETRHCFSSMINIWDQRGVGFPNRKTYGNPELGRTATTYPSSKLNRVGRGAVRYNFGLEAHNNSRPAPR